MQQYLQLKPAQLTALMEANRAYTEWTFEKQRRIGQVQREIAVETGRSPFDPMALGVRYAEIEAICRDVRNREAELEKANVNVLDDAQKAKLNVLEEALKVFPAIVQAQAIHLMGGHTGEKCRVSVPRHR